MIPERIAKKFTRPSDTECWVWTASGNHGGYGYVSFNGRQQVAHRVLYQILVGPIPEGLTLDHLCRNRRCVNPAHLDPVSNRENILRGTSRSALRAKQTHCKYGHPLSGENLKLKGTERVCLTCKRRHDFTWWHKQKARITR